MYKENAINMVDDIEVKTSGDIHIVILWSILRVQIP